MAGTETLENKIRTGRVIKENFQELVGEREIGHTKSCCHSSVINRNFLNRQYGKEELDIFFV